MEKEKKDNVEKKAGSKEKFAQLKIFAESLNS